MSDRGPKSSRGMSAAEFYAKLLHVPKCVYCDAVAMLGSRYCVTHAALNEPVREATSALPREVPVNNPMTDDELIALRACLHDEQTQPEGADPEVHRLYDYYETCKRLMATVDLLRAKLRKARSEEIHGFCID